jgi:hypothetical protein
VKKVTVVSSVVNATRKIFVIGCGRSGNVDKKDSKPHWDRKNPRSAELHKEKKKAENASRPKQTFVNGRWERNG